MIDFSIPHSFSSPPPFFLPNTCSSNVDSRSKLSAVHKLSSVAGPLWCQQQSSATGTFPRSILSTAFSLLKAKVWIKACNNLMGPHFCSLMLHLNVLVFKAWLQDLLDGVHNTQRLKLASTLLLLLVGGWERALGWQSDALASGCTSERVSWSPVLCLYFIPTDY